MTYHEDPETFGFCGYMVHCGASEWSACYAELVSDPRWAEHDALCNAIPQMRASSDGALDRLRDDSDRCAKLEAELIAELHRIVRRRVNLGI